MPDPWTPDKGVCPCCGSADLRKAYMLYPVFQGMYCEGCEEFIAIWPAAIQWFLEWFVAPWVDGFPVHICEEKAGTHDDK